MRRLQFALCFLLLFVSPALAQTNVLTNFRSSTGVATAVSPSNPLPVTGSSGGGAIAPVVSSAPESNHVLKNSAGNLVGLTTAIGTSSGWLMLFDATSAPADGSVSPVFCRYIKSDGTSGANSLSWPSPLLFSTGITAVFSTTGCFTKTASATATFSGQVQ